MGNIDSNGNEEWSKTFGGSRVDHAYSVQQTTDGGYIVAGDTYSFGDGTLNAWLIKTDSSGNKEWDKTFGGSIGDWAYSVQQTFDKGYILAGATWSFGAGADDAWLIKTDSDGNKKWDKTFGTSSNDYAYSVQQTSDKGYILAGYTNSFGAVFGDFWLIKTDSNGNEEWDKTFGDTRDDYAYFVQQTFDGGYILAGYTNPLGTYDAWLIKTDSDGNKEWDKTFGGSNYDYAYSVQQTSDGGYILAGVTESFGAGHYDAWVIKTDSNGDEEWNKTLGGSSRDYASSVQQTIDGGYIVAGYTNSFGVDWDFDAWLIKLKGNGTMVEENQPESFSLLQNYPNPFNSSTTVSFSLDKGQEMSLDMYNVAGQKITTLMEGYQDAGRHNVQFNGRTSGGIELPSGTYIINLYSPNGLTQSRKMMLIK